MVSFLFHSAVPILMRQEQSLSQDSTLRGRLSSGPPLISATVSWVWERALPPSPSKCVSFRITVDNTTYSGCGIHDVQLLSFPPFFLSYLIYLLLKRRMPSEIDGLEQRTAKRKPPMCLIWLLWSLNHRGLGDDCKEQAIHSTWKMCISSLS